MEGCWCARLLLLRGMWLVAEGHAWLLAVATPARVQTRGDKMRRDSQRRNVEILGWEQSQGCMCAVWKG